MKPCPESELLERAHCGELTPAQLAELKQHLAECADCRREWARLERVQAVLKEAFQTATPGAVAAARILARLEHEDRPAPRRARRVQAIARWGAMAACLAAVLSALALWEQERETRLKVSRVATGLRSIATALESYYIDSHAYPAAYEPTNGTTSAGDVYRLREGGAGGVVVRGDLSGDGRFDLASTSRSAAALSIDFNQNIGGPVMDGAVYGIAAPATRWGFIDAAGKIVIQPEFDAVGDFSEGFAAARVHRAGADKSEWGFIDRAGRMVIAPQFDRVTSFSENLCYAEQGGRAGYIDRLGHWAIPPKFYPARASDFENGLARVSLDARGDSLAWINHGGTVVRSSSETAANHYFFDLKGATLAEPAAGATGKVQTAQESFTSPMQFYAGNLTGDGVLRGTTNTRANSAKPVALTKSGAANAWSPPPDFSRI